MWVSSAVQLVELVQHNICQWSSVHLRRETKTQKKKKIFLDGDNESLSRQGHRHVDWMTRSQWIAGVVHKTRLSSGARESGEMWPCDWRSEGHFGDIIA